MQLRKGEVQATYEIDADCGDVDVRVVAIGEADEKGRFAAPAVAHDDDLEEMVATRHGRGRRGGEKDAPHTNKPHAPPHYVEASTPKR
jgi:hypothetical protein